MNSKLCIIAIIGRNRELGKNNKLLFNIPDDLKRFRKITKGHPVIMGRKTFESIGHPLPNRTNIIISGNPSFHAEGVIVVCSLSNAIEKAKNEKRSEEIFVIGGGSVYAQAIGIADRLYLTVVDAQASDADTFFPDYSRFTHIIFREKHSSSHPSFEYITLES